MSEILINSYALILKEPQSHFANSDEYELTNITPPACFELIFHQPKNFYEHVHCSANAMPAPHFCQATLVYEKVASTYQIKA